ncbi:MAG: class I tRNA ligase family protein, partial [bacterium]|nr:class I tRNA ligase family protein [bacterium]
REEDRRDRAILGVAHRALGKVTSDIDRFHFNTVVSTLMAMINEVIAYLRGGGRTETFREVYRLLLLMLAPLAPHVSHELWDRLGYRGMLATQGWPAWDEEVAREDKVVMVLQVNGKVRDRVEVPVDIDEATAEQYAFRSQRIQRWLEGGRVVRVVARPPRIVNLVVK